MVIIYSHLSLVILPVCIFKTSHVIELEKFNSIYNILCFSRASKTFSLSPPDANIISQCIKHLMLMSVILPS